MIELNHEKSRQVIEETFAMYKEEKDIPNVLYGRTIVHVYPTGDTFTKYGELEGYYQNLFFDMIIFNIHGKSMKMYRLQNKDAIFTKNLKITNMSVFKDGAFCVTIESNVRLLDDKAVTLYSE